MHWHAPSRVDRTEKSGYAKTVCAHCDDVISRVKRDIVAGKRTLCRPCYKIEMGRIGKLRHDPSKWATVSCLICEKQVSRLVKQIHTQSVCSHACRVEAMRRKIIVPASRANKAPRPRTKFETYYGAEWQRQREAARERDQYRCQHCGEIEGDRPLHVHHIVRFMDFESSVDANALSNLVTLCMLCHRRADAEMMAKRRAEGRPTRRKPKREADHVRETSTLKFRSMAELVCLLARHWKITRRRTATFAGICVGGLENSIRAAGTPRGPRYSRGLHAARDRCYASTLGRINTEIENDCWRFMIGDELELDPRPWSELLASGDNQRIVIVRRTHYLDWDNVDPDNYIVTNAGRTGNHPATKREWYAV